MTLLEIAVKALTPSRLWAGLALLLVALCGAWVAHLLRWPLANVLGPLVFVAIFQMLGGRTLPIQTLRRRFVAVLAVFLGAGFTPELVQTLPHWWPSVLGMLVLVPLTALSGFALFYLGFRMDAATAWYAAIPGGLMEMSIYGEQEGGDPAAIALIHLMRVISMIVSIPLAFSLFLDLGPRGAGAGLGLTAAAAHWSDWLWYAVLVFVAPWVGQRLRLPAGAFLGPMILSCLVFGLGWASAAPPLWILVMTQIVLGAGLGQRFDRSTLATFAANFWRSMALSVVTVSLSVAMALFVGLASHQPWAVLFLAFAPGGLAEMSLLAVSLQVEPVFVSGHHVVRIIAAVLVGTALFALVKRLVGGGPGPSSQQ